MSVAFPLFPESKVNYICTLRFTSLASREIYEELHGPILSMLHQTEHAETLRTVSAEQRRVRAAAAN